MTTSTTATTSLIRHGGDLTTATAMFGLPAGGWLDLSTGVSPHAYPAPTLDQGLLRRLPEPSELAALIMAARAAYRVPQALAVAAVPGSESAIRLLPRLAPTGPAAILAPTYRSHSEAWALARRPFVRIAGLDRIPPDSTTVVVVNPNNPDGRRADTARLQAVAQNLTDRGGLLVVDEAFADLTPELSLIPLLSGLAAIVLRSFGKFFGLPGLRLGFAIGDPAVVGPLSEQLGDWPVSTVASAIGRAALSDVRWQVEAREHLAGEAGRLRRLLQSHGLKLAGGTDLFALAEYDDAHQLHRHLAQNGIWTRAFAERPDWLRIGLPGDENGFDRLDHALSAR